MDGEENRGPQMHHSFLSKGSVHCTLGILLPFPGTQLKCSVSAGVGHKRSVQYSGTPFECSVSAAFWTRDIELSILLRDSS